MKEIFINWIKERQSESQFSGQKEVRQEKYVQYNKLLMERQEKYLEIEKRIKK